MGHTHSISLSLSLRMSRLTSLFLRQKWYITMFEPNSTYSHCILSHAHCLSRSLSPTRLTLSIARRPTLAQFLSLYICNRLTLLPPMQKIYLHVCDWIISQALSYIPHSSQNLNWTISLQSIYIFSMNVGLDSLCLSIYMSLDWPRFITPYLPHIEATSPSLAKPKLFILRGGLQPWINLWRHLFRWV